MAGKNIAIFGADPPWTSFMQAMGASDKTKSGKKNIFDAQALLDSAGVARRLAHYQESEIFYSPGDPASSVLCVQEGSVKLSVVNEAKKRFLEFWDRELFLESAAWEGRRSECGRRQR